MYICSFGINSAEDSGLFMVEFLWVSMKRKSMFYLSAGMLVMVLLVGYAILGLAVGRVLSSTLYLEVYYRFLFEPLESLKLYFIQMQVNVYDGWHVEFNGSMELVVEVSDDVGRLINTTRLGVPLVDEMLFVFDTYSFPQLQGLSVAVSAVSLPEGYRMFTYGNESFAVSLEDAEVKA